MNTSTTMAIIYNGDTIEPLSRVVTILMYWIPSVLMCYSM